MLVKAFIGVGDVPAATQFSSCDEGTHAPKPASCEVKIYLIFLIIKQVPHFPILLQLWCCFSKLGTLAKLMLRRTGSM